MSASEVCIFYDYFSSFESSIRLVNFSTLFNLKQDNFNFVSFKYIRLINQLLCCILVMVKNVVI